MARTTLREHGIMLRSTHHPALGPAGPWASARPRSSAWSASTSAPSPPWRGRTTWFVTILALPRGKDSAGVGDALIEHVSGLPDLMKGSP